MLTDGRILEKEKTIPIRTQVDVIVAGGGLAGVSAAVAASRAGAKTALIERNSFPGGVATAGMCCSVFNCFYTLGHNLTVKGNPLEFVNRLATQANGPGLKWQEHKGHIIYDVEKAKLALTDMLLESGVECLFQAMIVDTVMEGDTLRGLVIESKSGREALLAKVIVDATGDADVAVRSGAPYHENEKDKNPSTLVFRVGGVDVDKFVGYFIENPSEYPEGMDVDWTLSEAVRQYEETGTFLFPHGGGMQMKLIREGIESGEYSTAIGTHHTLNALQMHAIRSLGVVHMITGHVDVSGLDIGKISRAIMDGRKMAHAVTDYFQGFVPGFENAFVDQTATDLGIRISRWIDGDFVFTPEMKSAPSRCGDSIGRAVVENHYVKYKGKGAWAVQAFGEDYFQIPYACLLPRKVEGLLMGAGRSVSASDPSLLRVMVTTMIVGQGAGVAAAISAGDGVTPRDVDIGRVQEELKRQGVEV